MSDRERITPATEKQVVNTKAAGKQIVKPSCGGGGHWYCITHDVVFRNQFQKDNHIHRGTHQLAWICPVHGLEVP
jgi:hypothetical protein